MKVSAFSCNFYLIYPLSSVSFPADDSPVVNRHVKEADSETGVSTEAAESVRSTMERVLAAWESYKDCLYLLQVWLGQEKQSETQEVLLSICH